MNELANLSSQHWPLDGLQAVPSCPICAQPERLLMHEGLVDNSFRTAPGLWTLWRCTHCEAAYLDPCPSADAIHLAYTSYYTHAQANAPASWLHQWYQRLEQGYAQVHYGARAKPSSALGVAVVGWVPYLRRHADRAYRHLPRLPQGGGAVLDVGCGDGAFLALARDCGWEVLGLEFDPQAVRAARQRGVSVVEGQIDQLSHQSAVFDIITLAHVVEHVHQPVQLLRACHRLLKPGGSLWLETPNAAAPGLRLFGPHWRGLEAPRHLVLFTQSALQRALLNAGFDTWHSPPTPSVSRWMFQRSLALRAGRWPDEVQPLPWRWLWRAWASDWHPRASARGGEFLTVIARKSR